MGTPMCIVYTCTYVHSLAAIAAATTITIHDASTVISLSLYIYI